MLNKIPLLLPSHVSKMGGEGEGRKYHISKAPHIKTSLIHLAYMHIHFPLVGKKAAPWCATSAVSIQLVRVVSTCSGSTEWESMI